MNWSRIGLVGLNKLTTRFIRKGNERLAIRIPSRIGETSRHFNPLLECRIGLHERKAYKHILESRTGLHERKDYKV